MPWRQLRVTHPKGWIGFLLGNEENELVFSNQNQSPSSYVMNIYDMETDDQIFISDKISTETSLKISTPQRNDTIKIIDREYVYSVYNLDLVSNLEITVSPYQNIASNEDNSTENVVNPTSDENSTDCLFSDFECWNNGKWENAKELNLIIPGRVGVTQIIF
jgi:hypothetical protein